MRNEKMADVIREILERRFPNEAASAQRRPHGLHEATEIQNPAKS